jgi:hypothetical protein
LAFAEAQHHQQVLLKIFSRFFPFLRITGEVLDSEIDLSTAEKSRSPGHPKSSLNGGKMMINQVPYFQINQMISYDII